MTELEHLVSTLEKSANRLKVYLDSTSIKPEQAGSLSNSPDTVNESRFWRVIEPIFAQGRELTEYERRLNGLFKEIVDLDLSTRKTGFYADLGNSEFKCAEEVLRYASNTDRHYNNRTTAVKYLIVSMLKNAGIGDAPIRDTIVDSPSGNYERLNRIAESCHTEIEKKLSEKAASVFTEIIENTFIEISELHPDDSAHTRNEFFYARLNALCGLVYFNATSAVPLIKDLAKRIYELKMETPNSMILFRDMTAMATALYHLTKDDAHKIFVDKIKIDLSTAGRNLNDDSVNALRDYLPSLN